jgi:hypothetical protein
MLYLVSLKIFFSKNLEVRVFVSQVIIIPTLSLSH